MFVSHLTTKKKVCQCSRCSLSLILWMLNWPHSFKFWFILFRWFSDVLYLGADTRSRGLRNYRTIQELGSWHLRSDFREPHNDETSAQNWLSNVKETSLILEMLCNFFWEDLRHFSLCGRWKFNQEIFEASSSSWVISKFGGGVSTHVFWGFLIFFLEFFFVIFFSFKLLILFHHQLFFLALIVAFSSKKVLWTIFFLVFRGNYLMFDR